jgi:hypothetical protein
VLAFSACSSGPAVEPPARRGASSAIESPTTATTVPLPRTTTPAPTPPPLVNTGTDYVAIAKSLLEYGSWLLSHRPDATLLENVVVRGTDLYKAFADDVSALRHTNRRLVEYFDAPDELRLISTSSSAASLRLTQHLNRVRIVDERGMTVDERARRTTSYLVLIAQDASPQGHWRVASVSEASETAL